MRIIFARSSPPGTSQSANITLSEGERDEVIREKTGRTIVMGAGKRASMTRRKLLILLRRVIALARSHRIKGVCIRFSDFQFGQKFLTREALAEAMAVNFAMANYAFVSYKTPPKEGWDFVEEVTVVGTITPSMKRAFEKGLLIAEEVNKTRTLANTPGGDMTPSILAAKAEEAVKGLPVNITVLGRGEIEKLGMGGVIGVSKGSAEEPKFIILDYRGGSKNDKPVVLVGKGVTFDTGGVNIKTAEGMLGMNLDMSGGAAVIHTVALAARLKLKKNVIALVPAVENMPSGSSYRPGDVLRTMSGKTIEVLNTDAEGRVILADALSYAKRYKPSVVIDVATLTGAALIALGQRASALFATDDELAVKLTAAGEATGEYLWRMPLWEEYESEVKGTFGDVTNTHNKHLRYGGSINGAIFLYQFVKGGGFKWAHLDIAPRMESIPDDQLAPGAIGTPVRLLVDLLERGV